MEGIARGHLGVVIEFGLQWRTRHERDSGKFALYNDTSAIPGGNFSGDGFFIANIKYSTHIS